MQTEFIRSLQSNYERILLDRQPEEKKYQYCILSRGGIKGLLPCSLRYINGNAYLYYDISSKQNIAQLYAKRCITREWLKDFMWSFERIQMEMKRFLLDEHNVLWFPQQIYQDLENNIFSFLYVPYYEGENGFLNFLEYLVEHINYEDDLLVECVYKMYEQCDRSGEVYLQGQIYEDAKMLNQEKFTEKQLSEVETKKEEKDFATETENREAGGPNNDKQVTARICETDKTMKKGIFHLWDNKKKRYKDTVADYQKNMQMLMEGNSVAEENVYEAEEYGRTLYLEEVKEIKETVHRLYAPDGCIIVQLEKECCTIGKKKGEVDLVLDDFSVSRIHARIQKEKEGIYLEDLNSTNGTYKNGLRMQPYEKRKLEEGDEIKIGKVVLIYR